MNVLHFLAAKLNPGEINIDPVSADAVLNGVLNSFYVAAGIVAVVYVVIGGYRYTVSAGDSTAIVKAKDTILYAIVGLIIITLAFSTTWFVIGRFL
jgi:hypothetical protein